MTSVIVIDDDFDTVDVFSEYLRIKGVSVLGEAYNGKQAFELYRDLHPDVVLLDVMMPEYDGYYGLQKILEFDPNAKVIMVTGSVTPSEAELLKQKAWAVVFKPYDIDQLIEIIDGAKNGAEGQLINPARI